LNILAVFIARSQTQDFGLLNTKSCCSNRGKTKTGSLVHFVKHRGKQPAEFGLHNLAL